MRNHIKPWINEGAVLLLCCLASSIGSACVDPGQGRLDVPVSVAGVAVDAVTARDGWEVQLERADLAFGPLYLCPGELAGDLCETARAEWLDSVVVDALDPDAQDAGALIGSEGSTGSMMFDLGSYWPLVSSRPTLTAAGRSLGAGVVIEGQAQRGDQQLRFVASLSIDATEAGRSTGSMQLQRRDLRAEASSLLLRMDPTSWIEDVDFSALVSEEGEVVMIDLESQAGRAVRNGLLNRWSPEFVWNAD